MRRPSRAVAAAFLALSSWAGLLAASPAGPVVKVWTAPEDGRRQSCYWFRTERGVVLVNAPFLLDAGRQLRAELAADGEPGAIVVTGIHADGAFGAPAVAAGNARLWLSRTLATGFERRLTHLREDRIRAGIAVDRLPASAAPPSAPWSGSLNLGFEGFTLRLLELGQGDGFSFTPTVGAISETAEFFPGDLVWNKVHPVVEGLDLREWKRLLERLVAMRPRAVYPGYGAPGGREIVDAFSAYLSLLEESVQPLVVPGKKALVKSEAASIRRTVMRRFPGWELPANLDGSIAAEFARQREQRFGVH